MGPGALPPGSIPADQFQPAADEPAAQASQGLPEGSIPADQFQSAEDAYGTPSEMAKTAAEGVAEGVLGPAAPWAEKHILQVPKENILGRAEENPVTKAVGQTAGLIGSSMAGTGEGALLDEAGQAAVHATGLLSKGADASAAAKIGAGALKSAVETGLFQGGDETSKMILDDPNATAQNAISNIGLAAALGGTTGAALGSINPLWKATFGDKAAPVIEDMKSRLKFRTENPDLASAGLEELQNKFDSYNELKDRLYTGEEGGQGLKAEAIAKALPEDLQPAIKQGQELNTKFDDAISRMREDEYKYPKRLVNQLDDDVKNWQSTAWGDNATPEQAFNATQDLKGKLQEYAKFAKAIPKTSEEFSFVNDIKGLSRDLRLSLEDNKVWGKAADIQKDINKAVTEFIPAEKDFLGKFTTKVSGDRTIDPGKWQTYMGQVGKAKGELRQQMLGNFLDKHDELISAVNKAFTDQGLESQAKHTASAVLRDSLGEKTTGSKLMDQLIDHAAAGALGKTVGAGIGGTLGGAVGQPVLGALAGEHLLGKPATSVIQGTLKRLMQNETNAMGAKSAINYSILAAKAEKALSTSVKNIFRTGIAASLASIQSQDKLDKLDKVVDQVTENPNKLMAIDNGHLGHYMPDHQTAVAAASTRAVQYLQQLKPRPYRLSPLDKEIKPTQAQEQRYYKALSIAQDPQSVLQRVKIGTLQPSDIQDLNAMYPDLYHRMSGKISQEIQNQQSHEQHIPYRTRMGISLFLGQPMDSTMQPMSIIAAQPMPKGPPVTPQTPKKKGATSKLGKTDSSYMTPNQAAEADRGKGRAD